MHHQEKKPCAARNGGIHFWEGRQCRFCTVHKIFCFNSSRFFNFFYSSKSQNEKKERKKSVFLVPPNLIHVELGPYMSMTLEGGGIVSQLSNAPVERSCTVKGHTHFIEYKTKWQETLHLQYILQGRVIKSLNETTVCPPRAEWSTRELELSCWLSSWREIQSTLEPGSMLINDLWEQELWKISQQHWHEWQCSFPLSSLFLKRVTELCNRVLKPPCKSIEIQQVSSLQQTHNNIKQQQRNISQFTSFLKR